MTIRNRWMDMRLRSVVLALAGLCTVAAPAWGQQNVASELGASVGPGLSSSGSPAIARAVRRSGAISIDGRIDEEAWLSAPIISDFVQGEPTEGAPPTERTEVRVLFDDGSIYVAARLYERDPGTIHDQLVRRDERGAFDHFTFSLDPNLDGLTGYQFIVGASGAERDVFLFGDVQEDEDWNAVWDSAVHRDDLGWSVEMKIPISQIRYEAQPGEQTWGVNFARRRLESNETDYFSLQSRSVRGRVSQFGTIDGFQMDGASRRIEIRPFVVSEYNSAPSEPGNPLFDGTEFRPRGGVDVSLGVGSAFSLDATFNPDFGQVEVDPEVINLTAFETFFPEKRPFFVQDVRVFEFAGSQPGRGGRGGKRMFFSRRIGRSPLGSGPSDATFTDRPLLTTILGAGKLTGRTAGGLSVGVLGAVTARESGEAYFADSDSLSIFTAQPQAAHGVLRLQQDFRDGGSKIGILGTGIKRELPDDGGFDFLPAEAFSFGVDFEHQWGGSRDRDWRIWGFYAGSLVQGSTEAITDLQRSPIHYFQRPDADHLALDSTATSMFGSDWRIQFERQSALHWTWSAWVGEQTPGFDVNDLGFITSGERLDAGARVGYRQIRPGRLFRTYNLSLFVFANFRQSLFDDFFSGNNWARSYDSGSFFLSSNFTFLNNWTTTLRTSYSPQSQSDTQTRGGPLMTRPGRWTASFDVNTDRRAAVSLRPSFSYTKETLGPGETIRTGLGLQLRPVSNWEIELGPRYTRTRVSAQYVTSSDALSFGPTFGTRYIFGDLQRNSISMDTRVNVAFSPTASLQLFVQPLLSTGDYLSYRQLQASESFDFVDFAEGEAVAGADGIVCVGGLTCVSDDVRFFDFDGDGEPDHSTSDRDFNILSLRGNAVFRWEYRSGSEIFLVWQHTRRESRDFGDLDIGRDLGDLFSAESQNVFILKISQYLNF